MRSVSQDNQLVYVGLDVHKDSISAGVLTPGREAPEVDRFFADEVCLRRFLEPLGDPKRLRVCYEAGPTGFELARLLQALRVHCEVIAPSLIPRAPGDRIKTDRRDARRLVRLFAAGQLIRIHVPSRQEEAVRDLCRARTDMVIDRNRARHRLSKFLLRHGEVYRGGTEWTDRHQRWLTAIRFADPALTSTFGHYRGVIEARTAELRAVESDLVTWCARDPFAEAVRRLGAYRGVTHLGALSIAAEVTDWRRFPRAETFMGFCGLVPSEYSSGTKTWRGRITGTGNTQLRTHFVESAWSYRHRPAIGRDMAKRHQGLEPEVLARAWHAQQRLCTKFHRLAARKNAQKLVAVAVARELAGFCWAEMTA
jgi:transposase